MNETLLIDNLKLSISDSILPLMVAEMSLDFPELHDGETYLTVSAELEKDDSEPLVWSGIEGYPDLDKYMDMWAPLAVARLGYEFLSFEGGQLLEQPNLSGHTILLNKYIRVRKNK